MLESLTRASFGAPSAPPDRLWCGDNLDALHQLEAGQLSLAYIDPPFATGTTRRGRRPNDASLPPSYADKLSDPEQFVAWISPRLARSRDLLSKSGSLFVHLDHRVVHYVKVELDRIFGRGNFVNEIIWCYSVGGKGRRSFGRKHDSILWYGRGRDYAFYPDAIRIARKPKSHMRVVRTEDGELVQEKTDRRTGKVYRYPVSRGKIPEDWWVDIETLNRGDGERTGYPTQKPERLIERIALATTQEGDRVADFFAGSGTTGVVAQRLARSFVLVDRSADAAQIAVARLLRQGQDRAAAGAPPPDLEYGPVPAPAPLAMPPLAEQRPSR